MHCQQKTSSRPRPSFAAKVLYRHCSKLAGPCTDTQWNEIRGALARNKRQEWSRRHLRPDEVPDDWTREATACDDVEHLRDEHKQLLQVAREWPVTDRASPRPSLQENARRIDRCTGRLRLMEHSKQQDAWSEWAKGATLGYASLAHSFVKRAEHPPTRLVEANLLGHHRTTGTTSHAKAVLLDAWHNGMIRGARPKPGQPWIGRIQALDESSHRLHMYCVSIRLVAGSRARL